MTTLAGVLAAATPTDAHAQAESWRYEIVPFLWAAGLDGQVGIGDASAPVDVSFSDLVEFVNVGAAMRMIARRPPVSWMGEVSFVELENESGTALGPLRVRSSQTYAEGALLYELSSAIALYGGLRFQQLDTVVQVSNLRGDRDEGWVDGFVGGRWTPVVSDRWVAWLRGDVGAGGSDLVWLAEAGGGYRWTERWGAYLAYRMLDTDYEHGSFAYDVRQSGMMIGFGVRF